jgi:hypothetical protein
MQPSAGEDSTEGISDGDNAVAELHATDEEFQTVGNHRVPSLPFSIRGASGVTPPEARLTT